MTKRVTSKNRQNGHTGCHDWGISRKMTTGGFKRIFVRGDYARFQWNKGAIELYLSGNAGGEGGKLNVDPSLLQFANCCQTDTHQDTLAMSEDDIESFHFISMPGKTTEDGYDLYPLQDGRWVILPEDVDTVVLPKVRESMKQLGWTCTAENERCDTYSPTANKAGEVKLFAKDGRMLVSNCVAKAVAIEAGGLYMELLGAVE